MWDKNLEEFKWAFYIKKKSFESVFSWKMAKSEMKKKWRIERKSHSWKKYWECGKIWKNSEKNDNSKKKEVCAGKELKTRDYDYYFIRLIEAEGIIRLWIIFAKIVDLTHFCRIFSQSDDIIFLY